MDQYSNVVHKITVVASFVLDSRFVACTKRRKTRSMTSNQMSLKHQIAAVFPYVSLVIFSQLNFLRWANPGLFFIYFRLFVQIKQPAGIDLGLSERKAKTLTTRKPPMLYSSTYPRCQFGHFSQIKIYLSSQNATSIILDQFCYLSADEALFHQIAKKRNIDTIRTFLSFSNDHV